MMEIKNTYSSASILVVGAGPTGLMAALLLRHCGIKVRIFDKSEQQAHESRAFALHARSLELLLNIGLADNFLATGTIAPGMQIFVSGHKAAEMNIEDIGAMDSPYSFILMLPQSEIEKILIAELEKYAVKVERNSEVLNFTQTDQGVTATVTNQLGDAEIIHAAYLIGADGAHSVVRKNLNFTFEGAAYPQDFMLADCRIDWPLDYAFMKGFICGSKFGIYLPIKGESLGRVITIGPQTKQVDSAAAKLATTAEPLTLAEVEKSFQEATGLPVKLSNSTWTTRYRIHHRGVNQYSEGRVFLAGDAAHIHSPVGGQGMNTGLQDAANLAWKLALAIKGGDSQALLKTYHAERWPIGQKLLHFTDRLFEGIASQSKFAVVFRNIIFPLIMKIVTKNRRCKTRAFRFVSQLGIRYHDNAFLCDDSSRKLKAGQRAPNALFKRDRDIFSLIKGYQFHVLALAKRALSAEEIEKISVQFDLLPKNLGLPLNIHFIAHSLVGEHEKLIQAEINQVFENYGLSSKNPFGLFLVRPDGYIAYQSDEINIERLKMFCDFLN